MLDYMKHRNEVNEQLNELRQELIDEGNTDLLKPFIEKITWFIQQDELMVGRQYISYDEALFLVKQTDFIIIMQSTYTHSRNFTNFMNCHHPIFLRQEQYKLLRNVRVKCFL